MRVSSIEGIASCLNRRSENGWSVEVRTILRHYVANFPGQWAATSSGDVAVRMPQGGRYWQTAVHL